MSIVLQGSTSGSITLQEPAVAGSTTLTLPATTGNVVVDTATQTLTNKTLTSPTLTTPNIDSAQFATVSGTAPIYPCRAWVNFNGTGTVAIRASGNVTSITDGGVGVYTVNFTNTITDANYSAVASGSTQGSTSSYTIVITTGSATTTYGSHSTSALGINAAVGSIGSNTDPETVQVAIFR